MALCGETQVTRSGPSQLMIPRRACRRVTGRDCCLVYVRSKILVLLSRF